MKNLITYFLIVLFAVALSPNLNSTCSTIIAIDISTSMNETIDGGITKIDLAKTIAKRWVDALDMENSELAIVSFCADAVPSQDDPNEPVSEFSQNKAELSYTIDNLPSLCSGTNYNAAFLVAKDGFTQKFSALYYCKPEMAKYKPVIVFLTDGNHMPKWSKYPGNESGTFDINSVKKLANERNATIYVVKIGKEELTPMNLDFIKELAQIGKAPGDTTPNYWLDVENADELSDVYGCQTVGVSETFADNNSNIMLYPNPSTDNITVSLSDGLVNSAAINSQKLNITIFDFMGKKIKSYDFDNITNNYKLDISKLNSGSYFLKCTGIFVNQFVPFVILK